MSCQQLLVRPPYWCDIRWCHTSPTSTTATRVRGLAHSVVHEAQRYPTSDYKRPCARSCSTCTGLYILPDFAAVKLVIYNIEHFIHAGSASSASFPTPKRNDRQWCSHAAGLSLYHSSVRSVPASPSSVQSVKVCPVTAPAGGPQLHLGLRLCRVVVSCGQTHVCFMYIVR